MAGPAPGPESGLGSVVPRTGGDTAAHAGGDTAAHTGGDTAAHTGTGDTDPFLALGPGEAAMDRFVVDYLLLLDGRLGSIRRCLDDSDIEGARVAVLSLESSSLMLGGRSLAGRLTELRSHLDLGPTPQRNALLALVESSATTFRDELENRRS